VAQKSAKSQGCFYMIVFIDTRMIISSIAIIIIIITF
jgi:hypothetical protein